MSETTKYLSDYLNEMNRYMARLNRDELSRKDRKLFWELSGEYYDIFQQTEAFPEEILQGMTEFSDNITNLSGDGKDLARVYQDKIVQHANDYINASQRSELQFGIFQKDAEILSLQREKIQMLQELADLDMKMYGKITEQTQDILDVQNCEIFNGRVRELALWERNDAVSEMVSYQDEEQRVSLKFPYMTRNTFMTVKDGIKRMGAAFDPDRKEWYVKQSAGKEAITNIQDYINGHDEAIYLKLPPAGPKEFQGMIGQLKQDGARYNSDKKLWYITEKSDCSKFRQYLPAAKDSVHEKLNNYKSVTEKQHTNVQEMGSRRQETPERT